MTSTDTAEPPSPAPRTARLASICAAEYGKHPRTAVARMCWALALTDHLNAAAAA